MTIRKYAVSFVVILSFLIGAGAISAEAKPREYDAVVQHLRAKYHAKKVNLFFMWAARAVVSIAKPAGVKSFSLTVFRSLKFSRDTVDNEMQAVMRSSYGPEWSQIFHVRSRTGQQAYMYMTEAGENVKVVLVTIDTENAAVIRATFSPDKVADFINNPRIFGVSLDDDQKTTDKPAAADKPQNQ